VQAARTEQEQLAGRLAERTQGTTRRRCKRNVDLDRSLRGAHDWSTSRRREPSDMTVQDDAHLAFEICRIATAGAIPSIVSASGFSIRSRNCRA
jgi:hypothetical protein